MKSFSTYWLFIGLLLVSMSSCNDDTESAIDSELQPYVDAFQAAGLARGINIDYTTNPITAQFNRIPNAGVAGQCFRNQDIPNSISIDAIYWSTQSELRREFLMYHELGHCVIGRSHRDETDATGTCLSIMHSTDGICNNTYGPATRESYLDELFGF